MQRRTILAAGAALVVNLGLPLAVRADQAILSQDAVFELAPEQSVAHTNTLVLSRFGLPTVVFDGASGFADDETVVATITLSTVDIDSLGTIELLSPATLTGTTPAGWSTDPPDVTASEFAFDPPISFRYTAPSAQALDCAAHPGETFQSGLGIAATLVGSTGALASFSAGDFPGVVRFEITCGAAAPPARVTPPPTDTAGTSATVPPKRSSPVGFAIIGALAVLAVAAAFTQRASAKGPSR